MSLWDKDFTKGYKQKKTLFSAVKGSILNKEIREKKNKFGAKIWWGEGLRLLENRKPQWENKRLFSTVRDFRLRSEVPGFTMASLAPAGHKCSSYNCQMVREFFQFLFTLLKIAKMVFLKLSRKPQWNRKIKSCQLWTEKIRKV